MESRKKWIKIISKEGEKHGSLWKPSDHSVVRHKHFTESDFSVSTKRRKLLPFVVPSVFPFYPSHKLPESTRKRKRPTNRTLDNSFVKKSNIIHRSEAFALTSSDQPSQGNINSSENSENARNLVQSAKTKALTCKLHKRLKTLKNQNSKLRNKIKSLENKISNLKSKKNEDTFEEKQLKNIIYESSENNLLAVMLLDQINNFGKKKVSLNSTALKYYILWQKHLLKAMNLCVI